MANQAFLAARDSKSSVIPDRIANQLHMTLGPESRVSVVSDHGLSTAVVYRVETHKSMYALKRWPMMADRSQLTDRHRFQQFLSDAGDTRVPRLQTWNHGETCLESDGCFWELAEWKAGKPIERVGDVSDRQLLECASAFASLHQHSQNLHRSVQLAPGLLQRHLGLQRALGQPDSKRKQFLHSLQAESHSPEADLLRDMSSRALRIAPRLVEPMRRLSALPVTCYWVLRDAWREHLLYRGDQLTGIIDFGAARIDWPGLDLVRSFGTLLLSNDPRWSLGLGHYTEQSPESSIEPKTIQLVHRASVSLSALQWLDWFASGQFDWRSTAGGPWKRVVEIYRQLLEIEKGDEETFRSSSPS